MELEIRGEAGHALGDHHIGKVWCSGTSVMHSYYRDPEATEACMVDGWLDTGDMGYMADGLSVHRRPGEGHDHHQRQEPLAAGHRVGCRAASRLPPGRHRRLCARD
jgi:acyl-CoA synthetase (AMP-forming)/AMP-acid ligase II